MQFTTAIFTTLALALSARADSRFCYPIPGQPETIPQNILDLDVSIKLNWAANLCSQLVFPSPTDQGNGIQIATTALTDGILGDDGKLYGLEVGLHAIRTEDLCNVNANALLGDGACPEGGLLTLSTPFEQWSYITALN
ncbi:hypothetical protein TGAMA5MH_01628 [Trichoderma gamsii]|uniref:Ecp2 effector protein domain-containing protein n=1 Tax=Trichoderma gamsii TaxID=398673 RepID=A0A2K0TMC1_9HYPO|nr:hypothetical protein TGAMA5MH_01628 [Trichoderma gamsii]